MIYVDTNSDEKDIVIKMLQGLPNGEERFLCADIQIGGVDICDPQQICPTRVVLNIPTCLVKEAKMEVSMIKKTSKFLTRTYETLKNTTQYHAEIEVNPPLDSVNDDGKPVFFDTVKI